MSELYDCRLACAQTIEALAESDSRVIVLVNDCLGSSLMEPFARRYPQRVINAGIAEQDMVGISAGLANGGKLPFVFSASCFLVGRALEQIKVDLAYSGANVKLCATSPGLAYGELGATHHSVEDLAALRAIADLTIVVPADPSETAEAVRAAADVVGPVFLRISRTKVPAVHTDGSHFRLGEARRLREGGDGIQTTLTRQPFWTGHELSPF